MKNFMFYLMKLKKSNRISTFSLNISGYIYFIKTSKYLFDRTEAGL